jgi:predicted metal-dependent phosphoesterase TrpH
MSSQIDLHAHSSASDGALSPTDVVARAAERGVRALALTDHDTTDGLPAAQQIARLRGMVLVPGVEISVTWAGRTLHIVGLGFDAGNAPLQRGLASIRSIRQQRAWEMSRLLEQAGLEGAWEGVRTLAQGDLVGRAHYARLLVQRGLAKDASEAFRRYLSRGRLGYVEVQWAKLDEVVDWRHGAGGLAIVAHPLQYRYPRPFLRQMLAAFAAAGGDAIEVVTGGSTAEQVSAATAYAQRMDLAGSLGSDFHTPEQPWNDLGRIRPLPQGVMPIWERWPLLPQSWPSIIAENSDQGHVR